MGRKHLHRWSGCYAPPGTLDGPRMGPQRNGDMIWWRYCFKCCLVHKRITTRNYYSRRKNQWADQQNWYAELPELNWKRSKRIPRECRS